MSKARLVITAVVVEGRTQAEVAAAYGVSPSWVSKLVARYHAEGEEAFEARSRRPRTSPTALPSATVELILELREKLTTAGLDAGPETIAWHLAEHHKTLVSRATIHRILTRHGLVTPEPRKRPKSSYIRFQAAMPNETWQSDFTHYRLTGPDGRSGPDGRDHHLARRLHPLRALGDRAPPDHRPDRHRNLPANRCPARDPGLHADRQRHGLHRPPRRRPRRTQHLRARTAAPAHRPEELPSEPSDHLREGRTLPADDEEVAAHPTGPTRLLGPATGRHRPLRRRVQPPPAAPITPPPGHPRQRATNRCPRPCPATHATPTPTTGSGTTASTRPAPSPCATTAGCTT